MHPGSDPNLGQMAQSPPSPFASHLFHNERNTFTAPRVTFHENRIFLFCNNTEVHARVTFVKPESGVILLLKASKQLPLDPPDQVHGPHKLDPDGRPGPRPHCNSSMLPLCSVFLFINAFVSLFSFCTKGLCTC